MTRGPRASVFGPRDSAARGRVRRKHTFERHLRNKKAPPADAGRGFSLKAFAGRADNSALCRHARFIALVAHPVGKFGIGFPTMAWRRFADIGNRVGQRGDSTRAHPDGLACWRVCFGQQVINVYLVR